VIAAGENILPGMDHVAGVVKLQDGLILINDLDKFLSIEEEASLEQAMEAV
jgi:purine-binding chemotaxis protein CheW